MIAIGGALLAIIGAFLAWATVTGEAKTILEQAGQSTSVTGWDGDDGVIVVFAAVALAAMAIGLKERSRQIGMIAAAGIIVLVCVFNFFDITGEEIPFVDGGFSVGIGLYLSLIGGAVGLAAAFLKD
jgi:uncharacterized oligopeptide transporter (OPT) family protein